MESETHPDALLAQHRTTILEVAHRHGVRSVQVFGSRARGEASAESDVDLLIEPGEHRPFFFPGGLVAELEALLGRRVDVVTVDSLHPLLKKSVLEEAREL